jgi:hypothetical protein
MYGCVIQLCSIRAVRMYKSAGSRAREARGSWRGNNVSASIEQAGMDAKVVELRVSQREAESRNVSPAQRVAGCLRWDWG